MLDEFPFPEDEPEEYEPANLEAAIKKLEKIM